MIRRLAHLLLLAVVFVSILSGCGFKDLDKRFFVMAIGVDESGDPAEPFLVTLKLAIPSPKIEPGQEKYQLISRKGATIDEAMRLLSGEVDKELDTEHTKAILFGMPVARKNIREVIDYFERNRNIQEVAYLAIADSRAADILKIQPKSERMPANALFLSFGRNANDSPYIMTSYLFDFYKRLYEPGLDPFMPVVKPGNDTYIIDQAALFDKQRVRLILTPDETRMLNLIMDRRVQGDLKVKRNGLYFMFSLDNLQTTISSRNDKWGKVHMYFASKVKGSLIETKNRLSDASEIPFYAKAAEQEFEDRVTRFLKKMQSAGLDPLGFGLKYQATHFGREQDIANWREQYRDAEITVNVKVKINSTGLIY